MGPIKFPMEGSYSENVAIHSILKVFPCLFLKQINLQSEKSI